jgi:putative transposase
MTQGKTECYHRSLKNRNPRENYYLPGQLEARRAQFVAFYNIQRYHESPRNLTPADIYFGRGPTMSYTETEDQTQDHRFTSTAASAAVA